MATIHGSSSTHFKGTSTPRPNPKTSPESGGDRYQASSDEGGEFFASKGLGQRLRELGERLRDAGREIADEVLGPVPQPELQPIPIPVDDRRR